MFSARAVLLLQLHQPPNWEDIVAKALTEQAELVELIDDDFRNDHIHAAHVLRRVKDGESVSDHEQTLLAVVLGVPEGALEELLAEEPDDQLEIDPTQPKVMLTSLMGPRVYKPTTSSLSVSMMVISRAPTGSRQTRKSVSSW